MEKLEYRIQVMKITQDFVISATSTSCAHSNAPTTQNIDSQSSATTSFYENVNSNIDLTEDGQTFYNMRVVYTD